MKVSSLEYRRHSGDLIMAYGILNSPEYTLKYLLRFRLSTNIEDYIRKLGIQHWTEGKHLLFTRYLILEFTAGWGGSRDFSGVLKDETWHISQDLRLYFTIIYQYFSKYTWRLWWYTAPGYVIPLSESSLYLISNYSTHLNHFTKTEHWGETWLVKKHSKFNNGATVRQFHQIGRDREAL